MTGCYPRLTTERLAGIIVTWYLGIDCKYQFSALCVTCLALLVWTPWSLPFFKYWTVIQLGNCGGCKCKNRGRGSEGYHSSNILCSPPTLSSFSLFISVGGLTSKRGPRLLATILCRLVTTTVEPHLMDTPQLWTPTIILKVQTVLPFTLILKQSWIANTPILW